MEVTYTPKYKRVTELNPEELKRYNSLQGAMAIAYESRQAALDELEECTKKVKEIDVVWEEFLKTIVIETESE